MSEGKTKASQGKFQMAWEKQNARAKTRRSGYYMGVTRKRDLRIMPHPVFGPEARSVFGPRSSNAKTRKVAKRLERHYQKHGMIFAKGNRDS